MIKNFSSELRRDIGVIEASIWISLLHFCMTEVISIIILSFYGGMQDMNLHVQASFPCSQFSQEVLEILCFHRKKTKQ